MSVLTLNELKTKFGFTIPESRETYYQELLDAAISACYRFMGLKADGTASRTDYFDGDAERVFLRVTPVASISSISFKKNGAYEAIPAGCYRVDSESGILTLYAMPEAPAPDCIKVVYSAGWSDATVPDDIKYCIAETARYMLKVSTSSQIGVTSRTTEGGTEQLEQGMPPAFVRQHLRRYCLQALR